MLEEKEHQRLYEEAYLPEHLPDYVESVSDAESFLHEDHLCFLRREHLTFIGYSLGGETDTPRAYESACRRFEPVSTGIIAPEIWLPGDAYTQDAKDDYLLLNLPLKPLPQTLDYMVRRGGRELKVTEGHFGREHKKLVQAFLSHHQLSPGHIRIFKRITGYLKRTGSARLLEARRGGTLTAFSILDTGSSDYAFYLFNFRSGDENVPGASDLLFYEMAQLAQAEGKRAINLGLGINPGIRRFKEKWGGVPFLSYQTAFVQRRPKEFGALLNKL